MKINGAQLATIMEKISDGTFEKQQKVDVTNFKSSLEMPEIAESLVFLQAAFEDNPDLEFDFK